MLAFAATSNKQATSDKQNKRQASKLQATKEET
jgi:hypothetical protein